VGAQHQFKRDVDWENFGYLGKNRFELTKAGIDAVNNPPKRPDYVLRAIVFCAGAISIYQAIHVFLLHHPK
jgi:hypothetical protein